MYYNVSLFIVLCYSLKSWVVFWRLSLVFRLLYSPLILLFYCNVISPWSSWGLREDKHLLQFAKILNYFLRGKTPHLKTRQAHFYLPHLILTFAHKFQAPPLGYPGWGQEDYPPPCLRAWIKKGTICCCLESWIWGNRQHNFPVIVFEVSFNVYTYHV